MIIELISKVTNFTDKLEEQEAIVEDIVTNKIPSDSNLLAELIQKFYIKNFEKNKKITEMSSTGGGAPAATQATYTPGSGEGVAQKYAFAPMKKRKDENHDLSKKYKELFKKEIKDL